MAMYQCDECQRMVDGDDYPCVEHPEDPTVCCCESCREELLEDSGEEDLVSTMRVWK